MIDKVVICGVRMAKKLVPIREIKQSIGRAGRSYQKDGEAFILVPDNDIDYANACISDIVPPVKSELTTISDIAFHLLPWIDDINNEENFKNWFSKSLASVQGVKISWEDVKKYLEETGSIKDGKITPFGLISVKKYFYPDRLLSIKKKMNEAYIEGCEGELSVISWMFAYKHIAMGDVDVNELSSYKNLLKRYGLYFTDGELIHGYIYNCILTNKRPAWLKHAIISEMEDIQRLFSASCLIADIENIPIQDKLNETMICAIRKVPPEIARVIDCFNLNKKAFAYELFDMGISTKEDLLELEDYVLSYATENLKKELINKGFLQKAIILKMHKLNQKD